MTKANQPRISSRHAASERAVASTTQLSASTLIDRLVLLILLALIPFRAIANETITLEIPRLFRSIQIVSGGQPATTLFIAILIFSLAVLHRAARLYLGGAGYRRTGMELGLILLALAAVISTWRAGQKHLALIGVLDFLAVIVYGLTLRQLLLRPWQIRLALIVILSTGAMVIVKCGLQYWVELPQTMEFYEKHKAEFQPDSGGEATPRQTGLQYDYEQRLKARTVTGYYSHPNVLASHLILFVMAALALLSGRHSARGFGWPLIVPLLIAVSGAIALYGAQSKGALYACSIAIVIWLSMHFILSRGKRLRTFVFEKPRAAWLIFWCVVLCGAASFSTVAIVKPDLLGKSILFRTMYWRGVWNMMQDRGWLGVGANNFGRHFTRYKPVECPEEVESPHSWPVQLSAEWGVPGLVGFLGVLVGTSMVFAGVVRRQMSTNEGLSSADDELSGSIILWQAGLAVVVFGWWLGLYAGADPGFLALSALEAAIPWVIGFIALGFESTSSRTISTNELGPILPAICGGIIGFLIHTSIDLAMFHGAATTTLFAMVAIALATRGLQTESITGTKNSASAASTNSMRSRLAAPVLMIAALVVFAVIVGVWVRPVAKCSVDLDQGRTAKKFDTWSAYQTSPSFEGYLRAHDEYKLDGTAAEELIEELIPRVASIEHTEYALHLLEEFRRRDPDNALALNHLGALNYQRYHYTHNLADFRQVIDAITASVATYPTSPHRHLYLANMLEEYAAAAKDADARARAASELRTALSLEEKRIYVSQPNRLTDEQKAQINERLTRLTAK